MADETGENVTDAKTAHTSVKEPARGRVVAAQVGTSSPPVRPIGGDASRDKILDVAEALFAQRGFEGVGLQQVSDGVGLRKSSLFHHFRTKAHLYLAVLQRVVGRLSAGLDRPLASTAPPRERLEAWIDALVDGLVEHPTTARLCLRALFEDDSQMATPEGEEVDAALARVVAGFQGIVQQGIDRGDFRPVSLPDTTQTVIGATVYHFASGDFGEALMGGSLFTAEAVARRKAEVIRILRDGLATTESSRRRHGIERDKESTWRRSSRN